MTNTPQTDDELASAGPIYGNRVSDTTYFRMAGLAAKLELHEGALPGLARADGSDFLAEAKEVATRLDACARFDGPNMSESVLEQEARKAAALLREAADFLEHVYKWKLEGESVVRNDSTLFKIGKWWGERPWHHY